MAETTSAPSLRDRSERAAKGEWFTSVNGTDGLCRIDNGAEMWPLIGEWPEAELARDLVNAFRAGRLIDPATLTEAVAAARAEGWRPIETAPKDELVWLFEPHCEGGFMFAGLHSSHTGRWWNNLDDKSQDPTHWMPLPAPPTTPGGRADG